MTDDYLWDGTGDLDAEAAEVVSLRRTLAPLRYEAGPLRVPRATAEPQRRSGSFRWAVPVLAAAAAAVLVLGLRSPSGEAPESSVVADLAMDAETLVSERDVAASEASPVQVSAANASNNGKPPKTLSPAAAPRAEAPRASSSERTPPATAKRSGVRPVKKPRTRKPTPSHDEEHRGLTPSEAPRVESSQPRVDCILDGTKCKREDAGLRRTISPSEIRAGIAPLKSKARACGAKHGLDHEARVKVKMTVVGSTGRVSAASPIGDWAGTPLGACVAGVVSKARFPRFAKESLGVVYPISVGPKGNVQ